jgi:hypothetical protein
MMKTHTDINQCKILASYVGTSVDKREPELKTHLHTDMEDVHACRWCSKDNSVISLHYLTPVTKEEYEAGRKGFLEGKIDEVDKQGRELRAELASLDPIPFG